MKIFACIILLLVFLICAGICVEALLHEWIGTAVWFGIMVVFPALALVQKAVDE